MLSFGALLVLWSTYLLISFSVEFLVLTVYSSFNLKKALYREDLAYFTLSAKISNFLTSIGAKEQIFQR